MAGIKKPLVALLIAVDRVMRQAIIEGTRRITIREGYRRYDPGMTVMLCCHLEPWTVMADITNVRHCLLDEVTQAEWEADGYENREQMLEDLRRFYPKMTWDSAVTIISWENVRGKLVDDWNKVKKGAPVPLTHE